MATTKENKGKGLASDEVIQIEGDVLPQSHPTTLEKRKTISKMLDTGSIPSRRGNKKPKLGSFTLSKSLIINVDPSIPPPASTQLSTTSQVTTTPDANLSLNPLWTQKVLESPLSFCNDLGTIYILSSRGKTF